MAVDPVMHVRRLGMAYMVASAVFVVYVCIIAVRALTPEPTPPAVTTGAYCLPRPGLAGAFRLCRYDNVVVPL